MTVMNARFVAAFSSVLAHDLDRRALLTLLSSGRELRYEELRRAAGEPSPQLFNYGVDRLVAHALVNRRLVSQGKRFQSHFSPSARGLAIARILEGLVRSGRLPEKLPAAILADVRLVLAGAPAVP
jgi:hypothetical protein